MIGWRVKANLVFFLVGSLGLSYLMANQVLSILQERYSVFAQFRDAGGVFTNQEVTYRGITVGQVGAMDVTDDGVSIELKIDKEFDHIPEEGIEARVMFKSAVGEQFVDLLPATDDGPYLSDGDKIPMEQTSIPVSTQALLSTLERVLRGVPPRALKGAVDELGIGLTGRGPDLATILESTATLADLFAERSPEVEGLLRNGTKLGDQFIASRRDFATAIRELVTVSEALSQSRPDLVRLLQNTNQTSDAVIRLLNEHNPEINKFLHQFALINELQAQHSDDLKALMLNLPTALAKINQAFEPTTGLVRFGLVTDTNNPGCSYGTARRPPSDRSPRLPPKNARCGGSNSSRSTSSTGVSTDPGTGDGSLPGVDDGLSLGGVTNGLPSRMTDWSWTLYYLRGIES